MKQITEKRRLYLQEYNRKKYRENPQKYIDRKNKWKRDNYEKYLATRRKWHQKNSVKEKSKDVKRNYERRKKVLEYYSNGKLECACCGEKIYEFLTINHINGGGTKQRKLTKKPLVDYIFINNFPSGYNILCYNCNCGMSNKGVCPHKKIGPLTRAKLN